jgi:hypothetical protein
MKETTSDDFNLEEALKRGAAFVEVLKKRPPLEVQDYAEEEVGCMTNGWKIKEEICNY